MWVIAGLILCCSLCAADALNLSNRYDNLSYAGYRLQRVKGESGVHWRLRLHRPGQTPLDYDEFSPILPRYVSLGLRNLIGGDSRQLAGMIWTGGAHCCSYYWIVDVSESARVIFDSRRYQYDELQPVESVEDVDGDGAMELLFRNLLRGWHAAAFSNWPAPLQIFRFDRNQYAYVPANHLLASRATRDLPRLMNSVRLQTRPDDIERHNQQVFEAALTLIYASRGDEAESLIRKYSKLDWKEFLANLGRDPFYRDLRKQPGFKSVLRASD